MRKYVCLAVFINILIFCGGVKESFENNISRQQSNPRSLCNRLPSQRKATCRRTFRQLESQIQDSGLKVDNSTVALRYVNGSDFKVQGWCTSSTFLLHQDIMIKLRSALRIPISSRILYESVYVNIIVPARLSAKFSASHRVGVPRLQGGCRYLYTDDFKMYGSRNTMIRMKGTFSINASMKMTSTSYVIRIRPIADIDYSLKGDLDITWEYSGLNNVAAYIIRRLRVYINQLLGRTVQSAMTENDETIKLRLKIDVDNEIRKVFRTNKNGVRIITIPRVN